MTAEHMANMLTALSWHSRSCQDWPSEFLALNGLNSGLGLVYCVVANLNE